LTRRDTGKASVARARCAVEADGLTALVVIEQCAIGSDLVMFEAGDETEVGEKVGRTLVYSLRVLIGCLTGADSQVCWSAAQLGLYTDAIAIA
jgi:hypothetical protein